MSLGAEVPRNYPLARTFFEQAANLGNAEAMNNLGMLYRNGRGVQKDLNLARSWFEKAVALGNPEARTNLKRLEEVALLDVAARRASCMQTCATLQRSYVSSVCVRYSATADGDKPERTKCIDVSLTAAMHCRSSCREWASVPLPDNKCVTCFQGLIACDISQAPLDGQSNDKPYAVDPKGCLEAFDNCTADCRRQAAGTPDANRE